MGRRFRGPPKRAQDCDIPSNKDDNQSEYSKSVKAEKGSHLGYGQYSDEDEEDYSDEQYPLLMKNTNNCKIVYILWRSRECMG